MPVPYATFTNPQSLNLYTYVGNNPVNAIDADGHFSENNNGNIISGVLPNNEICWGNMDMNGAPCGGLFTMDDGAIPSGNAEAETAYANQVADAQSNANAQQAQEAQQQIGQDPTLPTAVAPPPPSSFDLLMGCYGRKLREKRLIWRLRLGQTA